MMEEKDYGKPEVIRQYIKACTSIGQRAPETNYLVGVNGIPLGKEFHATGTLAIRTITSMERHTVYMVVETKENFDIPLKSVMNISSLIGYHTTGAFASEFIKDFETCSRIVYAEIVDNFKFEDVFQPPTRAFLDFIAWADETYFFADKTIRYLGTVVRPYTAKKNSPTSSPEKYYAGMKRAMETKLWQVY